MWAGRRIGFRVDSGSGKLNPMTSSPYTTGPSPSAIAVDPAGKFAYVANAGSNSVSVVDLVALKEVTKIPVGQVPKRNTTALLP